MHSGGAMHVKTYCIVEGRRPAGFTGPDPRLVPVLGAYLAQAAHLDAASAFAHERLARELDAHGAPRGLLERCDRAGVAELRHARAFAQLAERRGVVARAPALPDMRIRALLDVALENAVEGVVRQTCGAAIARYRAHHAADPEVRRVMASVAEDEREHAELAFAVARWLHEVLDPVERVLVEDAMRHAVTALASELDVDPEPVLCARAGVPDRLDALAIWSGLSHRVWHGIAAEVWSAAA
jgi:hypothetical protein